jgi:hypothetical protein
MRRWRKMTWVLLIWCAAILVWATVGGANANHQSVQDCLLQGVLTAQQCQSAADVGTGIGVAAILGIGFFGFVFLSLIWFMTRPRGRGCPVCGELVKRGRTACASCGHDFAAASAYIAMADQRSGHHGKQTADAATRLPKSP